MDNSQIKEMLGEQYEMAQELQKAGVVKDSVQASFKDGLRFDFLKYLLFIALGNGRLMPKEIEFFSEILDYKLSEKQLMIIAREYHVTTEKYLEEVPLPVKYFVLGDAGKKIAGKSGYAKGLVRCYKELGQAFIAYIDDADEKETDNLTAYDKMLNDYLKDFALTSIAKPAPVKPVEKKSVEESLEELNSLTGLEAVKKDVNTIVNLLKVQKLREERGLKQPTVSKHLVFSGNPGTGKTTVARILANVYHSLGILSKGQLVEVDRSGLVSGYIGQTATKTQEVCESAMGGILFIDEAYTLTVDKNEGDYGQEAVDTLLKIMEDHRDDLIVIVAGYPSLMEEFLSSNPGLRSRFNKYINFDDYSADELLEILLSTCKRQDYVMSEAAIEKAKEYFSKRCENKPDNFANARDARNYLEKAIGNQAGRIVGAAEITKELLCTIEAEDLEDI